MMNNFDGFGGCWLKDFFMNSLKIWDQLISKTVHFVFIIDIKQLSCNYRDKENPGLIP